ncbi:DUF2844 domain-containing protein [Caballeronia sp. LP006]|uniref:DUF2844 domain-containing protein n=1 Tax=unclassified Caballeronia TaxID=2646786 RepID=UPI001FD0FDCA|nr:MULTISPECIES: DUF2844 domain-containing protein [unclassified Caballeronia]MDR5805458.1 DUF2844 domain-containing protein [Caballeronia sp. LZ001]MDR5831005.1 DUF2844 domain-containing protein [Caballeronia sp. LP006]
MTTPRHTLRNPHYLAAACIALGGSMAAPAQAQLGAIARSAVFSPGVVAHRSTHGLLDYVETTDANGIVVREYVAASGAVYAISWRGPAMPDTEALLGAYFQRFKDGANASSGDAGLHATRIANGDLVVENHVRLREFSGRAWLVSALPVGVSTADIQ